MIAISNSVDVQIDRRRVLRSIGYDARRKPSARVASLLDEHMENAHDLIDPRYAYVLRDIERIRRSCAFIEGSVVFESVVITRLLEKCQMVAVFLATIGGRLEEMVLRLAEDGLVLESVVLDAIGSVATEEVGEFVQSRIEEVAHAQGLGVSRRFSPGYCDWTVRQQRMVFRAMNGSSMGIRLTRACLMVPRKSISGILGIGPSSGDLEHYNPCRTCRKRNCVGRRM